MAGWGGDEAGASGSRQSSSGKTAIAGRGGLQARREALGMLRPEERGLVWSETRREGHIGLRAEELVRHGQRAEWSDRSKARGDGQRLSKMCHGGREGAKMNKAGQREGK